MGTKQVPSDQYVRVQYYVTPQLFQVHAADVASDKALLKKRFVDIEAYTAKMHCRRQPAQCPVKLLMDGFSPKASQG